jgi:hypothetical protein
LMLNDANLLRNDVQLFAGFDTDFHQGFAIVRTNPFGFRQFVANDLARQRRIGRAEWCIPFNLDDFMVRKRYLNDSSELFIYVESP